MCKGKKVREEVIEKVREEGKVGEEVRECERVCGGKDREKVRK